MRLALDGGADSTRLGSVPAAPGVRHWLRAGVSVCLWSGQPAGRCAGLDDLPAHEHGTKGSLPGVSAAHPQDFIVMVVDGASSHVAKTRVVPENIRLHRLSGYSPDLNLQEYLWDELRKKEFPNRVFADMSGVVRTLEAGRPRLASDRDRVRSICAGALIVRLPSNAS